MAEAPIDDQDIKFCQILTVMKSDIMKIEDPKLIKQYTIWLERLSEPKYIDKGLRNRYLLELARQIHEQILRPPFVNAPTRARTNRLRKVQRKESVEGWPNFRSHLDRKFSSKSKVAVDSKSKQSENSSWIDLSDDSFDNLACGDIDGEGNEEEKVKLGENHLEAGKKLKERYLKEYEEQFLNVEENQEPQDSQNIMKSEVNALKLRMKDLLEVKNVLRDTHCLTEDRKKTVDALHARLLDAQKKNSNLKTVLTQQMKNFADAQALKEKEIEQIKSELLAQQAKQLELIKHNHLEEKQNMEIAFQTQIINIQDRFQQQLDELKNNYELKINELVRTNSLLLREKDDEIFRLQGDIKSKENVTLNENNSEQVIHLRKCISKLDKLLYKNEKDYLKKIEKLKQEVELKEMSTQILLQTQKADLMMRNAAIKKEELDQALNQLEQKYKSMFEELKQKSCDRTRRNDQVLCDLHKLLEENLCYSSLANLIA